MATKKPEPLTRHQTVEQKMLLLNRTKSEAAIKWFYTMAKSKLTQKGIPKEAFNLRINGEVFIGGMFLYTYDPKWKDKLPWYDTLPVVIPIEIYDDGWLGLNIHYLPPMLRAKLMDRLIEYRKRAFTPRAYMKVSYQFLKAVAKTELFAPCVHRYLGNHVTSNLIRVSDEYWEQVAMLPIQKFQKKSAQQVWRQTGSK